MISKAANNGEVFKEALKSDDCVAIYATVWKIGRENEWIVSNHFISTKFDKYEKERKEREQVIKYLEENVSVMNKKVKNLEKEIDKHEQYSHQNCLLVHRIVETDDSDWRFSDRHSITENEHWDFTCKSGSNIQYWEKATWPK